MKRFTCQLLLIFTFFGSWGDNRCRALDLNGDGVSDVWQAKYGITMAMVAANPGILDEDPDGDGFSNAQEAVFGTNPFDHNDCPTMKAVALTGFGTSPSYNQLTLSWRSIEGAYYVVESSITLGATAQWAPVVMPPNNAPLGQIIGVAGTQTMVTFLVPKTNPRKFYRVRGSATSMPANFSTSIVNWELTLWGSDPNVTDTDQDGIVDTYEFYNGLNPNDPADASALNSTGITNLQAYSYEGLMSSNIANFYYTGVDLLVFYDEDPHYNFTGALYFFDNFVKTPPPYGVDLGNKYVISAHQTEYFGGSERLCNHTRVDSAVATYTTDFENKAADDESIRWGPGGDIGGDVQWTQGNYPDSVFVSALSDAQFKTTVQYLTAQAAPGASAPHTFVYPILVSDSQITDDGAVKLDPSGNPIAPLVYGGSVTFNIAPGGRYPTDCTVNQGSLPAGIVRKSMVNAAGIIRACALVTLTPPAPNTRRTLIPLKVLINETSSSQVGGALFKVGDNIEFSCSTLDQASFPVPAQNVRWSYAARKMNGSWEPWTSFGGQGTGVSFTTTMQEAGVFRIKVAITGLTGTSAPPIELELLRNNDEIQKFFEFGPGLVGAFDCVGVAENELVGGFVREAQSFLSSRNYDPNIAVPAQYGWPAYPASGNSIIRCNLFIAHRASAAGLVVPPINGLTLTYPPVANQWAGIQDCDWTTSTFESTIDHWNLFFQEDQPRMKPGMIIAHPEPDDAGHCAIVDYDGEAIAAGSNSGTVNKLYPNFFDGTSSYREYEP